MTELWRLGVEDAAEALRTGEVTSVALVQAALDRADETEHVAHAWAYLDREPALAQARASDRRRAEGAPLSPVDGVPLGVKDVIDVAGMPTVAGSESLRLAPPAASDAASVAQYRAHGGVLLGKTHTYEFAFGQGEPPTRNPRDPLRYPGGSSIGSGVAVAVGSAPATLGTDTGGSIRNPASINGLVGLKPTTGLVSTQGTITISTTMDAIGPLTASVDGCAFILDAICEPEVRAQAFDGPITAAVERAQGARRVGVDRGIWRRWGVSEALQGSTLAGLALLDDVEIVEIDLPSLDLALVAGLLISLSESVEQHRSRLQRAAADYLPGTRTMVATGALIDTEDIAVAHRVRAALRREIERTLQTHGLTALASPTLPAAAPLLATMAMELTDAHDEDSLGSALRMLSAANLTGLPALSVPGTEIDGLPVGLHLLGAAFADAELLALGRRAEQAMPWRSQVPLDPRG